MMSTSGKFTAAAWTSSTTSPFLGSGLGTSSMTRLSGGPYSLQRMAFMVLSLSAARCPRIHENICVSPLARAGRYSPDFGTKEPSCHGSATCFGKPAPVIGPATALVAEAGTGDLHEP